MKNCQATSELNLYMARCDDERRLEVLQDSYIDELMAPGKDCDPLRPDNLADALELADLSALCEYIKEKNYKMACVEIELISTRHCKHIAEQRAIEDVTIEDMKDQEYYEYLKSNDHVDYR